MVFNQDSGWGQVVFLSTMDTHRNKSEISKIWDVSTSGGPLYRDKAQESIERYVDAGLLEKRGSTYKANLESEEFKKTLEDYFDSQESEVYEEASKDVTGFIEFLQNESVKNHLLKPQLIRKFFDREHFNSKDRLRDAKDVEIPYYFMALINAGVTIWVDEGLDRALEDMSTDMSMIKPMMKGMYEGIAQDFKANMDRNIQPVIDEINELDEMNPEALKWLRELYDNVVQNRLEAFTN